MSPEQSGFEEFFKIPLEERVFPNNSESPRFGHLRALYSIYKAERVPDDVGEFILNTAERERESLEAAINYWNGQVISDPRIAEEIKNTAIRSTATTIASSYGIVGLEKVRVNLITSALEHLSVALHKR